MSVVKTRMSINMNKIVLYSIRFVQGPLEVNCKLGCVWYLIALMNDLVLKHCRNVDQSKAVTSIWYSCAVYQESSCPLRTSPLIMAHYTQTKRPPLAISYARYCSDDKYRKQFSGNDLISVAYHTQVCLLLLSRQRMNSVTKKF